MNRPVTFRILLAGLASVYGCGGGKPLAGGTAGSGVAGSGGMAGSIAPGAAGAAGQSTAGASAGGGSGGLAGSDAAGTGGAAGQSAGGASGAGGLGGSGGSAGSTDGGTAGAGGTGTAGAPGTGLGFGGSDVTKGVPTTGCGMDPGQAIGTLVMHTIQTMGTKAADCADSVCGPWMYTRQYFVKLPLGYDNTKAYPLLFEGPGCGATGINLYPLPDLASTVIRVGLTPPPNAIGHATNPGQGCFDESDGDNSVDWVFYENLYDRLAGQLCVDRNRVFVSGEYSGGGRFADELACKYAGDATRPIRGVMSNAGDWPTAPSVPPTCTTKPMAGMWVHQIGDLTRQWSKTKIAIARAMAVNGCTLGTGYDDAQFEPFPIGHASPDTTSCKRIKGCPELSPLVVCLLPGNQHSGNENVVNPGWPTFIKLFSAPPLLTP